MPDYTAPKRDCVALLTFAVQNDCTLPGSPVGHLSGGRTLASIETLVKGFRGQGAPVVHLVRLYRPDGLNVDACRRRAVEEGLRVLMPGTMGAELIDAVKPDPDIRLNGGRLLSGHPQQLGPNEWALYRPRWGAFYGTCLEEHLKALGVNTIAICGGNFSTAVRATIYEASARDFRVVVAADAVSGASDQALTELGRIGVYLMNADCCISWLNNLPRPAAA